MKTDHGHIERSPLRDRYRRALSAAVSAKADYLAVAGDPSSNAYAIQRAAARWQKIETHKRSIAAAQAAAERLPGKTPFDAAVEASPVDTSNPHPFPLTLST